MCKFGKTLGSHRILVVGYSVPRKWIPFPYFQIYSRYGLLRGELPSHMTPWNSPGETCSPAARVRLGYFTNNLSSSFLASKGCSARNTCRENALTRGCSIPDCLPDSDSFVTSGPDYFCGGSVGWREVLNFVSITNFLFFFSVIIYIKCFF